MKVEAWFGNIVLTPENSFEADWLHSSMNKTYKMELTSEKVSYGSSDYKFRLQEIKDETSG